MIYKKLKLLAKKNKYRPLLNKLLIGIIPFILIPVFYSCEKDNYRDFSSVYSDIFPDSDTVNFIFPPDKYKLVLNIQPDLTCFYTTNGNYPDENNGILYDAEKGILLDVGSYTVKVIIYRNDIKADNIASKKYIIYGADVINLIMTDEQEQLVYDSRNEKIEITNPEAQFEFRGKKYQLDRLATRGESALDYRRKSFSVHLDKEIQIEDREYSGLYQGLKDFKLVAMVHDYTYIENRVAIGLLHKVNLWNLFYKYVEVRINNNTQGVYLLIEDPEDYALDKLESEFILRRGYRAQISKYEYNPWIYLISLDEYINTFNSIYSFITLYDNEVLYDSLASIMNLDDYFRKMAVDYLLRNGDLTDEIYLYSSIMDNKIYFNIIPWDYDDIFANNPHEVGQDWAVGNIFGERSYKSVEDIKNDVGEKLIFSIEDDLDYKIAKDDYLYSKYLVMLEEVINSIDNSCIENTFEELKMELKPFYENQQIIEQSKYDRDPTNYELYNQYYSEKLDFLIQRRAEILSELN
jgi:spore coat protein H